METFSNKNRSIFDEELYIVNYVKIRKHLVFFVDSLFSIYEPFQLILNYFLYKNTIFFEKLFFTEEKSPNEATHVILYDKQLAKLTFVKIMNLNK